ncbi:hypothetical protein VN97_g10602 [Penicillium thymicola]|uniref:HTH CENPB-type domain-containing protein n=1 Tax=Penicillium thymicola TaxID=293382 RepID=A0AAI9X3Z7_PENTH|nr:hypothetical protein VN97_g10602 [Penicillium thymicola]
MPEKNPDLEKSLADALTEWHARKKPKIAPLAREFGVPYSLLYNRVHGRGSRSTRCATNSILNSDQEQALISWIIILDDACSPPTAKMIEGCANSMILREDASRSPVDKNWVYRFLKRIPPLHNLHFIKQKPKEKKRMEAEDISYLTTWYQRLNQYIESNQLRPRDFYNFDETGFQIGQGKPQKVVSKSQTLSSPNGGIAEGITGIECIAADGWKMAP